MKKGLNNNELKIIALVTMTLDHIGVQIFPQLQILRIIGRLSFPIFAYMIAEGCKYTRNRKRYLGIITVEALLCQIVFFLAEGSYYMNILITLALSIAVIYVCDYALKKNDAKGYAFLTALVLTVFFVCEILPKILSNTDFTVDYGFFGVMMPVVIYLAKENKTYKLLSVVVMCILLSLTGGHTQWFGLLAVLPLALYNGERGRLKLKYLFYVYYPLHLVAIYAVSIFI